MLGDRGPPRSVPGHRELEVHLAARRVLLAARRLREPLPLDSPLRTHPKVTPLPHIGSATHETRHGMAELAVSNLLDALAGRRPAAVYDTAAS